MMIPGVVSTKVMRSRRLRSTAMVAYTPAYTPMPVAMHRVSPATPAGHSLRYTRSDFHFFSLFVVSFGRFVDFSGFCVCGS